MRKFILVQPALDSVGGHYYDFAVRLLSVAETAGYQPVLAVHRRCGSFGHLFPAGWRVIPVFAQAEGRMRPPRREFARADLRGPVIPRLAACHDWVAGRLRAARWRRHASEFRGACRSLFEQVSLSAGDHVLFASAGELDLAGLADCLRAYPAARQADWSFLFHYSLLVGRESDYVHQEARLALLRQHYRAVFRGLEGLKYSCYATTERLAAQFNRLGITTFRTLPYPINPAFREAASAQVPGQPLRVVCAGGVRQEKGAHVLADVIARLDRDYLRTGRIQLFVQSDQSRKARRLLRLPANVAIDACPDYASARVSTAPVVIVPHPLDPEDYVDLVQRADVGLFLYDGKTYYARCSGVLLEMLSAGRPVIVPAGCWQADQLQEPCQRHLRGIAETATVLETRRWIDRGPGTLQRPGRVPGACSPGLACGGASGPWVAEFEVPLGTTELLLTLRSDSVPPGTSIRVDLAGSDEDGQPRTGIVGAERVAEACAPAVAGASGQAVVVLAIEQCLRRRDDCACARWRFAACQRRRAAQPSDRRVPWGWSRRTWHRFLFCSRSY